MILTRRGFVSGLGTAAVLPSPLFARNLRYDLADPSESAYVYAKVAGTTEKARVFLQYYGEIFSVIPNTVQTRILRLKGLVRSDWTPHDDGRFTFRNFDQGLFCDPETGEVIDSYENPLTGEVNEPLHYRSGVLEGEVGKINENGDPFDANWRVVGDQLSVTQTGFGERENWLQPSDWPKASTGENVYFNTSSTYLADVDDVNDESLPSVPADHIWTFLTPFPAWMLLGQIEGFAMWRWVGRKIVNAEELDPTIVEEVESRAPGFMGSEDPWDGVLNGWIQYTQERDPVEG